MRLLIIVLIFLVIYYGGKYFFRQILPGLLKRYIEKKMGDGLNFKQQDKRKEGEVKITPSEKKSKRIDKDYGDYTEYEEID